jgi:hypothetical protein
MAWGGTGTLILDASCTGGTLLTAGVLDLIDNSNDAVTISEKALSSINSIFDEILPDLSDGDLDIGADLTLKTISRALFARFYREVYYNGSNQIVKNDSGNAIATMATTEVAGVSQTKGAAI